MRIEFDFRQCIVCIEAPADTWEHVIPGSVGGRLQARLLCSTCNSTLGSILVSKLQVDPSIRWAVECLKDELPELYASTQEGLPFEGKADDGSTIKGIRKGNILGVLFGRGAKGSIIQDTGEAKKRLRKTLGKQGFSTAEIENLVARLDQLKDDQALQIPDGSVFVKRTTPAMKPQVGTEFVDERLPALIAYEFLALLLGKAIYDHYFDEIREYIRTGERTARCTVQRMGAEKYGTFHALDLQTGQDDCVIFVRFFRLLVFSVHFSKFPYLGIDGVYLEDVKEKKSFVAKSRIDASQGKFYVC